MDFEHDLVTRSRGLREAGLWRELRCLESAQGRKVRLAGRELTNFSSNDYLGMASHPALREAAMRAVGEFGAGAGASRLICGTLTSHAALEEALAGFKGTEAALVFGSGYSAATGTIQALLEREDVIVIDRLVHASIVEAARGCGARLRVFAHNDLNELEEILVWARRRRGDAAGACRVLVVTESVFSMDGDVAPLLAMAELKDRHGAWLMVDEAHATGLFGERRSGLVSALGLEGRVEVQMSTLGKALGAAGGCIAGSRALVEFLINRARSFIFSTAPVPAMAAAAQAAVALVQGAEGEGRCRRLWGNARWLAGRLRAQYPSAPEGAQSAILPVILGAESEAMRVAAGLCERGFLVPGIRYPTVARGKARLRFTVSAEHTEDDVDAVAAAVEAVGRVELGGDDV